MAKSAAARQRARRERLAGCRLDVTVSTPQTLEWLDEIARDEGLTRGELVEHLIQIAWRDRS